MADVITKDQRFRAAFLFKCAEQGLSVADAHELVKSAIDQLSESSKQVSVPSKQANVLSDMLGTTAKTIGTGALLLPPSLAAVGGYALGRSRGGLSEDSVAEEKDRELIEAYRDATRRARQQAALAEKRRSSRGKAVRSLL